MTIAATIEAENQISACGITARSEFGLCRALIAAGHNPALPLDTAWPDGRPSMRIASLAAGARWTVQENAHNSPRFVLWQPSPFAA